MSSNLSGPRPNQTMSEFIGAQANRKCCRDICFAGERHRPERRNMSNQSSSMRSSRSANAESIFSDCQLSTEVFTLEDDIHTIMGELLSNAIQATLKKSRENASPIMVNATNDSQYFILKVRDEGVGIAPEIQSRIFDPFFATHRDGINRGRGLA